MLDLGSPKVNSFGLRWDLVLFCPLMSKPCALWELFLLSVTSEIKWNPYGIESRRNLSRLLDLSLRWKSSLCLLLDLLCRPIPGAPMRKSVVRKLPRCVFLKEEEEDLPEKANEGKKMSARNARFWMGKASRKMSQGHPLWKTARTLVHSLAVISPEKLAKTGK